MSATEILNLLGSLALFLYGMKVMSDGLMRLAGDRMRKVMTHLTSNRFKGVLTGVMITGLIQSSSATTLMVVSFVNAELLKLSEAISVIMGANIGTTFTAWLITILGFKVSMSAIAVPLVIVGLILYLNRRGKWNNLGSFIIGFAILFIGLELMKESFSGIEQSPMLYDFFERYTNIGFIGILFFVALGSLLTILLQSSSATMAITLVAASQGILTFEAAAAVVLGENIGTTITANLAAAITAAQAKRAALAHFIFNSIGVVWILALFTPFLLLISEISEFWFDSRPFSRAEDIPVGLAVFHTLFNVLNTLLLIGFVGVIAKVVIRSLPNRPVPEPIFSKPKYLKNESLAYPETAISALVKETKRLYQDAVIEAIAHGLGVHRKDIRSDEDPKRLLQEKKHPGIAFDEFLVLRITPIYRKVLKYASKIQQKFELSDKDQEKVTNLKRIHRDAGEILANIETLSTEIVKYSKDKNETLQRGYLELQASIIVLLRLLLSESETHEETSKLDSIKSMEDYFREQDVRLMSRVDELIRKEKINSQQAVSLMTSSAAVLRLTKLLIRAKLYLIEEIQVYEPS